MPALTNAELRAMAQSNIETANQIGGLIQVHAYHLRLLSEALLARLDAEEAMADRDLDHVTFEHWLTVKPVLDAIGRTYRTIADERPDLAELVRRILRISVHRGELIFGFFPSAADMPSYREVEQYINRKLTPESQDAKP